LESVYFLDANTGMVVGWGGTILRTIDGVQTGLYNQMEQIPYLAFSLPMQTLGLLLEFME